MCELNGPHNPRFLLAGGADKAAGVVGLAQGGHNLPLDEVLAAEAASPVHSLVVQGADVLALPHEEAPLGQFASTYCDEGGKKRGRKEGHKGSGRTVGKEKRKNEGWTEEEKKDEIRLN